MKELKSAPEKQKSIGLVHEIAGWIGTVLVLTTFGLEISKYHLQASSTPALVMNLIGGITILNVCIRKKAWQPGVVNAIWALIAIWGLTH